MTRPIVYSAGYQGLDHAAFCDAVVRLDLRVVDVRLKPQSRNFIWNRSGLAQRLGARYVWLPELGNLNYKGGPIAFQDAATGFAKLRAWLADGRPLVLLCVCADPRVCHRTVALRELADECEIQPWPPADGRGPRAPADIDLASGRLPY